MVKTNKRTSERTNERPSKGTNDRTTKRRPDFASVSSVGGAAKGVSKKRANARWRSGQQTAVHLCTASQPAMLKDRARAREGERVGEQERALQREPLSERAQKPHGYNSLACVVAVLVVVVSWCSLQPKEQRQSAKRAKRDLKVNWSVVVFLWFFLFFCWLHKVQLAAAANSLRKLRERWC